MLTMLTMTYQFRRVTDAEREARHSHPRQGAIRVAVRELLVALTALKAYADRTADVFTSRGPAFAVP